MPCSRLLKVDEVAEILRVTERTIRTWTAAGRLPALKIGGRVLYRAEALDALIEELETGGGKP